MVSTFRVPFNNKCLNIIKTPHFINIEEALAIPQEHVTIVDVVSHQRLVSG